MYDHLLYEVHYTSTESMHEVWRRLRRNCAGDWDFRQVDEHDGEKTYHVMFECEEDVKVLFRLAA